MSYITCHMASAMVSDKLASSDFRTEKETEKETAKETAKETVKEVLQKKHRILISPFFLEIFRCIIPSYFLDNKSERIYICIKEGRYKI